MAEIHVLDHDTIDKIAAGEVVERPSSVVKELVENAVDAGAGAITVEIKSGGIEFIRVTDDGCGIEKTEIQKAFMRHATSKIKTVDDLTQIASFGFRGEALSSISAVSKIELITKTKDSLTGVRFCIEGTVAEEPEEIGAPDGTTIIMRNLFFNTPVRRKFLKQPQTEGGYIADLMEHLALGNPNVSFKFVNNNQVRFHTSGNGDLREIIYRIYGKDIAFALIPLESEVAGIKVTGFLGKPEIDRSNRNFENYFVNDRFIKSDVISRAIEEGYKEYLMQHKYPFCVLHFIVDTEMLDVNVHPTKMDIRIHDSSYFYDFVVSSVRAALRVREMIPDVYLDDQDTRRDEVNRHVDPVQEVPEPFEANRAAKLQTSEHETYVKDVFRANPVWTRVVGEDVSRTLGEPSGQVNTPSGIIKARDAVIVEKPTQMNFFEEHILTEEAREHYRILGQVFDTYWLIAFQDKLYFVDQHAAHEKVKYERFMKRFHEKEIMSQSLNPPIIVNLTGKEEIALKEYMETFREMGFEIEEFGGSSYAVRAVPVDLFGCDEKELFTDVLDELVEENPRAGKDQIMHAKIASMACKAAVKGNTPFSFTEMNALIDELLTLENPYNCPHGRPTIISMTKYELEKKFKRIV
ncbi:MAG: DNA mismatch repair endonuclease MutL [Lachnospiraceae bacterium]|nr:DNA mismatch repair endonuclease MutL [Lachnospiraceae bacterium]